MNIYISRISPIFPSAVFIQWELYPDNGVAGDYTFTIRRSGSPSGPWTTVSPVLTNAINFTDRFDTVSDSAGANEEINLLSLARDIYYQVVCTAPNEVQVTSTAVNLDGLAEVSYLEQQPYLGIIPNTNSQRESDPRMRSVSMPRTGTRLRLLRRKILRDEYTAMRLAVGIEIVVLKRRHFGTRCNRCYDPLTRGATQTKCPVCYGTSWTGGFFTGILTYGKVNPAPVQASISPEGVSDLKASQFVLLAFPKIEESDILVEVATDRRWLVSQVVPTELRRIIVHQRIMASEIGRGSVEYMVSAVPALNGSLLTNPD